MKMMKKILTGILASAMVVSSVPSGGIFDPVTAKADTSSYYDNGTFRYGGGIWSYKVTTTNGKKSVALTFNSLANTGTTTVTVPYAVDSYRSSSSSTTSDATIADPADEKVTSVSINGSLGITELKLTQLTTNNDVDVTVSPNSILKTVDASGATGLGTLDLSSNTALGSNSGTLSVSGAASLTSLNLNGCSSLTQVTWPGSTSTLMDVDIRGTKLTDVTSNSIAKLEAGDVSTLKTISGTGFTVVNATRMGYGVSSDDTVSVSLSGASKLESVDVSGSTTLKTLTLPGSVTNYLTSVNASGCVNLTGSIDIKDGASGKGVGITINSTNILTDTEATVYFESSLYTKNAVNYQNILYDELVSGTTGISVTENGVPKLSSSASGFVLEKNAANEYEIQKDGEVLATLGSSFSPGTADYSAYKKSTVTYAYGQQNVNYNFANTQITGFTLEGYDCVTTSSSLERYSTTSDSTNVVLRDGDGDKDGGIDARGEVTVNLSGVTTLGTANSGGTITINGENLENRLTLPTASTYLKTLKLNADNLTKVTVPSTVTTFESSFNDYSGSGALSGFNTEMESLTLRYDRMESISVNSMTKLTTLNLEGNYLTSLDLSTQTENFALSKVTTSSNTSDTVSNPSNLTIKGNLITDGRLWKNATVSGVTGDDLTAMRSKELEITTESSGGTTQRLSTLTVSLKKNVIKAGETTTATLEGTYYSDKMLSQGYPDGNTEGDLTLKNDLGSSVQSSLVGYWKIEDDNITINGSKASEGIYCTGRTVTLGGASTVTTSATGNMTAKLAGRTASGSPTLYVIGSNVTISSTVETVCYSSYDKGELSYKFTGDTIAAGRPLYFKAATSQVASGISMVSLTEDYAWENKGTVDATIEDVSEDGDWSIVKVTPTGAGGTLKIVAKGMVSAVNNEDTAEEITVKKAEFTLDPSENEYLDVKDTYSVKEGGTVRLQVGDATDVTYVAGLDLGANGKIDTYRYRSSDYDEETISQQVVNVSDTGLVTAKKTGYAIVTVINNTESPSMYKGVDYCIIKVYEKQATLSAKSDTLKLDTKTEGDIELTVDSTQAGVTVALDKIDDTSVAYADGGVKESSYENKKLLSVKRGTRSGTTEAVFSAGYDTGLSVKGANIYDNKDQAAMTENELVSAGITCGAVGSVSSGNYTFYPATGYAENTAKVTITSGTPEEVTLSLSADNVALFKGKTAEVTALYESASTTSVNGASGSAASVTYTWVSEDEKIATVTNDGGKATITGVSPGTTTIQVVARGNVSRMADVKVTVTNDISKVTIEGLKSTYEYTGSEVKPDSLRLIDGNYTLVEGADYEEPQYTGDLTGSPDEDTTITGKIKGKGDYAGSSVTFSYVIKAPEKTPEEPVNNDPEPSDGNTGGTTDPGNTGGTGDTTPPEDNTGDDNTGQSLPVYVVYNAGDVISTDKGTFTVLDVIGATRKVAFTKPASSAAKTVTIPATVTIGGYVYNVTTIKTGAFDSSSAATTVIIGKNIKTIEPRAFKGSRVKILKVRTKLLTKSGVKKSLTGSKVRTIRLQKKAKTKKFLKKYKTIFKKSNSGRKVTVKK